MTEKEQIKDFLRRKVPVYIYRNNDTGDWQYSVAVLEGRPTPDDFWLNSFDTEPKALAYVKKHGLKLCT